MSRRLSSKTVKTLRRIQKIIMDPKQDVGFNMSVVEGPAIPLGAVTAPSCGTCRCIGGWMLALANLYACCGIVLPRKVLTHYEPDYDAQMLENFRQLFFPPYMAIRTAEEAVVAIDRFIKTDGAQSWE